jgi:hypothetical protein
VAIQEGFQLTTFASGFPENGATGPAGVAFPSSGGVLVTDAAGNVRVFPTDTDGQNAASVPPTPGSPGLADAPRGIAKLNGLLYMTLYSDNEVVQVSDSGIVQAVVARNIPGAVGITTDPLNGHLFVSSSNGIYDVDPASQTATIFVNASVDGMAFDPSTDTLYGATTSQVVGYDLQTKAQVFASQTIAGTPDGIAVGTGGLAGLLLVNNRIVRLISPPGGGFGGNPTSTPTPTATPTATPTPTATATPTPTATPPVILTSAQRQTVAVGKGRKAKNETVLVLYFSAPLNASAAENLAAYSLLPGKVKRRAITFINKPVPLASAVYDPGAMTVTLFPRRPFKPGMKMQLQITAALLTDALGRPVDNGHNYSVSLN